MVAPSTIRKCNGKLMANFFDNMAPDDAGQIEQLARLIFEFRVSRDSLLKQYAVADATILLEKIVAGVVPEHPGYDHYLSIIVLDEMREVVRTEMKAFLPKVELT